jgi:hypothetical protein
MPARTSGAVWKAVALEATRQSEMARRRMEQRRDMPSLYADARPAVNVSGNQPSALSHHLQLSILDHGVMTDG